MQPLATRGAQVKGGKELAPALLSLPFECSPRPSKQRFSTPNAHHFEPNDPAASPDSRKKLHRGVRRANIGHGSSCFGGGGRCLTLRSRAGAPRECSLQAKKNRRAVSALESLDSNPHQSTQEVFLRARKAKAKRKLDLEFPGPQKAPRAPKGQSDFTTQQRRSLTPHPQRTTSPCRRWNPPPCRRPLSS